MSVFAPPGRVNGNPVWQYLGYAQITTTASNSATSATAVTGLSATVTVPSGITYVRVTCFARGLYTSAGSNRAIMTIWSGTVGSGTQIGEGWGAGSGTAAANGGTAIGLHTPSAGSVTYNIGLHCSVAGTANIDCTSTAPAFILVECC